MHVLLVDDDDTVRRAIDRVLRAKGHTSKGTDKGAEALRLLRSEHFDLVILDMLLHPGEMTGWDVAREKLLDPSIRGVPVIVLSGLTPEKVRDGAKASTDVLMGTMLLLQKPWDPSMLFKALDFIERKAKTSGEQPEGPEPEEPEKT